MKVDGITLLQMIEDGKIKGNTLIEVTGGIRAHHPYIFIDENKIPYWKNEKGTIKTIVYAIDLLEYEFEIIEEIDKPKSIKKLSYQQIGSWSLEQHNYVEYARNVDKQISQLGNKLNELIDVVNGLKKEDDK